MESSQAKVQELRNTNKNVIQFDVGNLVRVKTPENVIKKYPKIPLWSKVASMYY